MALFFVVCLAVTLLCSSLFRNQLAAGGVALVILIAQALLTQVPGLGDYMPGKLLGWGIALLKGPTPAIWGTVAMSVESSLPLSFSHGTARKEL